MSFIRSDLFSRNSSQRDIFIETEKEGMDAINYINLCVSDYYWNRIHTLSGG
jgi:hypothetical protein